MSTQTSSSPAQPSMLQDASKGPGLLFGTLLVFCLYGFGVAIQMIWLGKPAGLLELVLFGLLATDGLILLTVARGAVGHRPGLFPHLGVWILGLIPYFGWALIYAIGKGIASFVENRLSNVRLLALLLWISVLVLCSVTYWLTANASAAAASAPSG